MSQRSCEANRALAQEAVLLMTEEVPFWPHNPNRREGKKGPPQPTKTLLQLSTVQINRFIVCGSCSKSGIDPKVIQDLFAKGVERMIHKVDIYREYGFDPEKSRANRLEYKRKYREENKEYIAVTREATRRDNRIETLNKELEET